MYIEDTLLKEIRLRIDKGAKVQDNLDRIVEILEESVMDPTELLNLLIEKMGGIADSVLDVIDGCDFIDTKSRTQDLAQELFSTIALCIGWILQLKKE